jgi:hypothetical protein
MSCKFLCYENHSLFYEPPTLEHSNTNRYKKAKTIKEYIALGGSRSDAKYDIDGGYLKVLRADGTWCSSAKRENFNNVSFSCFYYTSLKLQEYHSLIPQENHSNVHLIMM